MDIEKRVEYLEEAINKIVELKVNEAKVFKSIANSIEELSSGMETLTVLLEEQITLNKLRNNKVMTRLKQMVAEGLYTENTND
jgi:hypothetical protein|tara:strand:- start:199 stop:447 length:249 start_codon:yes stop_codon:yes gene_type:complete